MHYKEKEVIAEIGEDYRPNRTQIPNKYKNQAKNLVGLHNPKTITEEKIIRSKAKKLKTSDIKQERARGRQISKEINWK
ncbi:MAG: hypothetical protein N2235_03100 [Fischerella sp.]|nr:hypothetical protein [Fischerella sp.]